MTTQARASAARRSTLLALATAILACALLSACGGRRDAAAVDAGQTTNATRAECEPGTWVDTQGGAVCIFARDQALVIEGGFACPAAFAFRIDTATAIACGEHRLDRMPAEVCAEIEGACDVADDSENAAQVDDTARPIGERYGGPGECVTPRQPCMTPADCAYGGALTAADNFACEDGGCVWLGCNDDAECALWSPDRPTVCRADARGRRGCRDVCAKTADCPGEPATTNLDCVDGACFQVGCRSDAECGHESLVCAVGIAPIPSCELLCQTPDDCAEYRQRELGLDGPDPNEVLTNPDVFNCRHGICIVKELGCTVDLDCIKGAQDGSSCMLPE